MSDVHASLSDCFAPDPFVPDPFPRPTPGDKLRRYLIDERDAANLLAREFAERQAQAEEECDPSMANECSELALLHSARSAAMQDVLLTILSLERAHG